jgi:hypothetical protein
MTAEFRNSRDLMQMLVRVAHKLADDPSHQQDADDILEVAHQIQGRSLVGSMPEGSLLQDLASLLGDLGIDFAVIGGVALSVHGQVRNTEDIDVLVSAIPPEDKTRDVDYMQKFNFYRARSSTGTNLIIDHRKDGYVELLLADNPLRQYALSTATPSMVLGVQVPVVSAAALIGLKIQAMVNNPGRTQDAPDILSIWIKSEPDLTEIRTMLSPQEIAALDKIVG